MMTNTKGVPGKILNLTIDESLILLGLKPGKHYSGKEMQRAFNKKAKEFHPDHILSIYAGNDAFQNTPAYAKIVYDANQKMSQFTAAREILIESLWKKLTHTDVLATYEQLKKIIPEGATDQKIDTIIAREIDKLGKKNPEQYTIISDKFTAAGNIYKEIKERTKIRRAYIPARARGIVQARTIEAVKWGTPELRMILEEKRAAQKESLRRQNSMILERIKRVIHGKTRVPVISDHPTQKKKKIIRWIILTASLAAAIITGKYLYNHYHHALRNRKIAGYLTGPREVKR